MHFTNIVVLLFTGTLATCLSIPVEPKGNQVAGKILPGAGGLFHAWAGSLEKLHSTKPHHNKTAGKPEQRDIQLDEDEDNSAPFTNLDDFEDFSGVLSDEEFEAISMAAVTKVAKRDDAAPVTCSFPVVSGSLTTLTSYSTVTTQVQSTAYVIRTSYEKVTLQPVTHTLQPITVTTHTTITDPNWTSTIVAHHAYRNTTTTPTTKTTTTTVAQSPSKPTVEPITTTTTFWNVPTTSSESTPVATVEPITTTTTVLNVPTPSPTVTDDSGLEITLTARDAEATAFA